MSARASKLYAGARDRVFRRTDRLFAWLMVFQWLAGIIVAMQVAPLAWDGTDYHIHIHLWTAVFLGGAIFSAPLALILTMPGSKLTRHVVAIAQALFSALLIHLSGGRIETHFHIFGMLAFLAFYRDWPVLISATLVVGADHALRGLFWPQSVYGVGVIQPWRWLEHAGWIVYEDIFLFLAIGQSLREMRKNARHQADLEDTRDAARAASRAKSEFLSTMSHEIRTPMNAILGMAEVLYDTPLEPDQRTYLDTMVENGRSLVELINGILDLARIESGRLVLEKTEFNLPRLIEQLCETMSVEAHRKHIELALKIASDVSSTLYGDSFRLRQILLNLIGNAIKFTEHGAVVLKVDRVADCDDFLSFAVSDTGIGISEEQQERIFANFTQADSSTTRKYGGTGLGLSIAKRLVEMMEGNLGVTSVPQQGSTFHFTAHLETRPDDGASVPALPQLDGLRILVVDDTDVNREILHLILTPMGARIGEAASGRDALEAIEAAERQGDPYRLVLLDCRMPEMDGIEVARRARTGLAVQCPLLVMLTSDDLAVSHNRMKEFGLDAFMVKPIRKSILLEQIASAMKIEGRPMAKPRMATAPALQAIPDNLRILVVDDSRDNQLLVRAYLKNQRCVLECADDGAEAVRRFINERFDVVLMDMQMPVMDGRVATRAIRDWESLHQRTRTPIIALTASALPEDRERALAAGCDLHLAKPVRKAGLLKALQEVLAAHPPEESAQPLPAD